MKRKDKNQKVSFLLPEVLIALELVLIIFSVEFHLYIATVLLVICGAFTAYSWHKRWNRLKQQVKQNNKEH